MIQYRLRDYLSVLCNRLLAPWFGSFGRRVRLIQPRRIYGARYMHLGNDVTIQAGANLIALTDHDPRPQLRIEPGASLGHRVHIVCTHNVLIGAGALLADNVFIADNGHEFTDISRPVTLQGLRKLAPVSIGAGAWLGENCCIIGASVGKGCVIGANSVVLHDIPDFCVAAGSPATPRQRYCPLRNGWFKTLANGEFVD
jgi:acetyltransferase-like isoleucine patch superfamily enzyme